MNKLLKLSFGASVLLLLGSCKKFVDVNTNPNQNTTPNSLTIMTGALNSTYRNQVNPNLHIVPSSWTGLNAHSTSFTGGGAEKTYAFTNADFDAFTPVFDNISDYQVVIENADKDGVSYLKDAANVMQCYAYQELVDLYGDIPYNEALKGAGAITPKYTDQKVIYEDLVVRLDSAMARISKATWPTDAVFTVQDIYFKNDKTKWIRFANTIKLRILMRQSFMPGRGAYITTNINSTLANGYLQENVLCNPGYQVVAGKLNQFYSTYGFDQLNTITSNHQYRKMGAVIINWLKTSNSATPTATGGLPLPQATGSPAATANADTFRLQALAWPKGQTVTTISPILDNYVGIPLAAGSSFSTPDASAIGPIQITQGAGTKPAMLMLLAESNLLQAEAAFSFGITFPGAATAQSLYEAGILAHFRTCAAPSTAGNVANAGDAYFARYIVRPIDNINWTASANKVRAILIQKWITLSNINGLEAWSEYRKSSGSASVGVPFSVRSLLAPVEPVRYLYPQPEIDANSNNVPKNIDKFATKIFWDVN